MAEKGKLLVLQMGSGGESETFTTIASTRSDSFTVNNEQVDVTTKSSNGWSELLAGAGIQKASTSIQGVLSDADVVADFIAAGLANAINNYKLVTLLGTFAGAFAITSFELGGVHNGEQTFTASLESSGAVTFVAAG